MTDVELVETSWNTKSVYGTWRVDGDHFKYNIEYPVNLSAKINSDEMDRFSRLIGLYCFNQAINLAPTNVSVPEDTASLVGTLALDLWDVVGDNVWAQWRYQNGLPGYRHPRLGKGHIKPTEVPVHYKDSSASMVLLGGGKDSLLSYFVSKEEGTLAATASLTFSEYGSHASQRALLERFVEVLPCKVPHHFIKVVDEFQGTRGTEIMKKYGLAHRLSAETPLTYFASLPLMKTLDIDTIVFGHESSADIPNMLWSVAGESTVNHQWGKSMEAEQALHSWGLSTLGVQVVSSLAGVSEYQIFKGLQQFSNLVPRTHSCNIRKPWCLKCPKCAYVFLGMATMLDESVVEEVFLGGNPLDDMDNARHYAQLFGLEERTPFECVGSVSDSLVLLKVGLSGGKLHGKVVDWVLQRGALEGVFHPSRKIDEHKLRGGPKLISAIQSVFPDPVEDCA